ncbi:hypothetical protein M752DRAFT_45428 [Aspergillus phoenicis ATCC 13157]|uniref:Uncharacterized protein n=1 Tax=Aspergillus phoenicis ATCC 13157 TaxID=1353007 RepID=A0A370PCF0_ASPPH|nr:hypothetical protein M752DRAFT_45428 [Aspergillus phoenicis ATCC 13157]
MASLSLVLRLCLLLLLLLLFPRSSFPLLLQLPSIPSSNATCLIAGWGPTLYFFGDSSDIARAKCPFLLCPFFTSSSLSFFFFVFFFFFYTHTHTHTHSLSLSLHRQSRDILPRFSWLVFDKLDDFPYSAPSSPILPALLRRFSCCSCRGLVNFGLQCPQTLGFPPPHSWLCSSSPTIYSTIIYLLPAIITPTYPNPPVHPITPPPPSPPTFYLPSLSLSLSLPPADSLGFFLPTLYFVFFFQPTDHDLSPFAKVSFPL